MTDEHLSIHIGSIDDMGARFIQAWHSAERGKTSTQEHVTFLSLEAFITAISPKRLVLIQHLRKAGPMSVRKMAGELKRDYKSVHGDVTLLVSAGLIMREAKDLVAVHWDELHADMRLAA
jgi:predicted transcriptional regulator